MRETNRISVSLDAESYQILRAVMEQESLTQTMAVRKILQAYLLAPQIMTSPEVTILSEAEIAERAREIADRRNRRWR